MYVDRKTARVQIIIMEKQFVRRYLSKNYRKYDIMIMVSILLKTSRNMIHSPRARYLRAYVCVVLVYAGRFKSLASVINSSRPYTVVYRVAMSRRRDAAGENSR